MSIALTVALYWFGGENYPRPNGKRGAVPLPPPPLPAAKGVPSAAGLPAIAAPPPTAASPARTLSAGRAALPPAPPPSANPLTRIFVFGEQGPVALADIPPGRFHDEMDGLPAAARDRALGDLAFLRVPFNNVASLHVDAAGLLFFACARSPEDSRESTLSPPLATTRSLDDASAASSPATARFDVAVPISNPPIRHSKAGATRIIYLDFNGHNVTGTSWNSGASAPATYVCTPYDTDGNTGSFSPREQDSIVQIWDRIAETFRMFDVDVTTEEPAVFTSQTARLLITKDRDANGVPNPESATASGVAYLNVFGTTNYPTVSNVAFVYQRTLTEGEIAAVGSHEIGHNLGLSHDGTSAVEYYNGHGGGETAWAPIMGNGRRQVSQWSKGEYFDANNPQDDLAIIAAKLTIRPDDYPGAEASATPLTANGAEVQIQGTLETNSDGDTFSFSSAGGLISLQIGTIPNDLAANKFSLDIAAELRDASGALILRLDPAERTSANLTTTLPAGTFFLRVTPAGTGTPLANPPSGYTPYGSIGSYRITGTIPAPTTPTPPAIVQEPENQSQFPGNNATFSIVARGNPATTFAWQRSTDNGATWRTLTDDNFQSGTATATLTASRLTLSANGDRFRGVATNSAGTVTSQPSILTVSTPPPPTLPAFVAFPIAGSFGRAIPAGTNQNLTVSLAAGSDPISLSWQRDGVDLPGSEGPAYFLRNWQAPQSGVYRVVATNAAGSVTSPGFHQFVTPEGGWHWRNPLPTGNGLTRAAYLNGLFIVGGLRGTLLTSNDGIQWTIRTVPAANNLFSFHFFNGLYVALGSLGAVFTSPDTIAWTPRNAGTVHRDSGSGLQDMALGDGRLVAVGLSGLTSTSNDGINWTPATAGTTEDLGGVVFAFDRFHAVTLTSGRIYSSADGVTWTSLNTPSAGLRRIAFGTGRLVAAGNSGELQTSTNGTTWTAGTAGTAESLLGVNYVNGQFIAVGTNGVIRSSLDGLTWTGRNSSGNRSNLQNVVFGQGLYLIPGQSGTTGRTLLSSNDGLIWRETIIGAGAVGTSLRAAAAGPNELVAVGTSGTILHSSNGQRWNSRTSGTSSQLNDVTFGAGLFIAVGNSGVVLASADALTWSPQAAPANLALNGIIFEKNLWIITGASGRIFTSSNGTLWTQRTTNTTNALNKSAFGNGIFVAVGSAGTILNSTDGITWNLAAAPTKEALTDVAFGGGTFVTVGSGGATFTSTNGTTWTNRSTTNEALSSVNYAIGHFIATGIGSAYYLSTDGATWNVRFTGALDPVLSCVESRNELFLVGENSAILAAGAPLITTTNPPEVIATTPATLTAAVAGSAFTLTYQWTKDGAPVAGATNSAYLLPQADLNDSGDYRLLATGPQGSTVSAINRLTVVPPLVGRIINLSVRAIVGEGGQALITGFFISPGATKTVLIRGIGPSLAPLGVTGGLADPALQLFSEKSPLPLATNDNWAGGALLGPFAAVGAFPIDPASLDAALQINLASGAYTGQVLGNGGTSGIALLELYDSDPTQNPTNSRLTNVSARAQVGIGANVLIAGFAISGNVPRTILVRAIGPSLAIFGVSAPLADPQLEVYRGALRLYANDNWGTTASPADVAELATTFARVGAFPLPNSRSRDSALRLTLAPGNYTAQISGVNGTTGVALVEVYEIP